MKMRVLLTSFQKSGTHQIMPALGILDDVVDRSYVDMQDLKDKYIPFTQTKYTVKDTCNDLRTFKHSVFGHIPYLPEYAEAVQAIPTKVIFNVRDPRDVVVSNFYNMKKICYPPNKPAFSKGLGHLNFTNIENGKYVIQQDDPIAEIIKLEATRWPYWLGWLDHDWTLMVKYEDLRTHPTQAIQRIAEFVAPYKINIPEAVGGLQPDHSNPTFRAGRIGDWKTEFSDKQKKLAADLLGETIERLGYEL